MILYLQNDKDIISNRIFKSTKNRQENNTIECALYE